MFPSFPVHPSFPREYYKQQIREWFTVKLNVQKRTHFITNILCIRKLWAHLSVHFMVKRVTLKLQVNKSNVHNCLGLLYMRRSTSLHISGSSLEVVSPHLLHFTEATNETNFFSWMFHICNFPFSTVDDETILYSWWWYT